MMSLQAFLMLEKVQTSPLVEVMILGEKEVFQAET